MAINGDDMEYFKKLQCYKPKTGIIDAPISIEEIALLQNSVDKNIFGRVKFINRSLQEIIAIFIDIEARNIADEIIPVEKERFIYQDMQIEPGELYGNKIPIHLPEDTRIFKVRLEKVVFANGDIWNCSSELECECIPQQEIDIPEEIVDRIQNELMPHFEHMEYIHYYYEAGENFWECTCGKVNGINNEKCTFCGNKKQSQEEYLSQEKLVPLIVRKKQEKQVEEEKLAREVAEKEKLQKEAEKEESEHKRKILEQQNIEAVIQQRKEKKQLLLIACILGVIVIGVVGYIHYNKQRKIERVYQEATLALEKGNYEEAVKKFIKISDYNDSKKKLEESSSKFVETEKDKWNIYFNGGLSEFADVLCYLGETKEFIDNSADFMEDIQKIDDNDYVCECQTDSYKYVELEFDQGEDAVLQKITVYGMAGIDEIYMNYILKQDFNSALYNTYTWDFTGSNNILSEITLEKDGYALVNEDDGYYHYGYALSFYTSK